MSKRDTFYFPHEYNAKDDPKCERLIWNMGMEGYGIFWTLIEVLRAQPDYTYPVANIPIIARKYNTDENKMRRVVFDFGLFTIIEDNIFFSKGLIARMQPLDKRRNSQSDGGKKGAEKRWGNRAENGLPDGLPNRLPNRLPYSNKIRKDKIREDNNESKESADKPRSVASKRTAFVAPSLEEVRAYVSEQRLTNVNPDGFFDYYEANGWRTSRGPLKDWRAAARNWNRRRYFSDAPQKTEPYGPTRQYRDL